MISYDLFKWLSVSVLALTLKENHRAPNMEMKQSKKNPSIQHLAGTSKRVVKVPPPGYVCNICSSNGHYILNCPKRTTPATATLPTTTTTAPTTSPTTTTNPTTSTGSKEDPAANPCKIFVSGLLFSTTKKDLNDMFGSLDQVVVSQVRLLHFPDGKKCNGQAFVVTTSAEGARIAISTLDGTHVTDAKGNKRLLKVVPAASRNVTKKRKTKKGSKNGGKRRKTQGKD